jgi:hypothetical protein
MAWFHHDMSGNVKTFPVVAFVFAVGFLVVIPEGDLLLPLSRSLSPITRPVILSEVVRVERTTQSKDLRSLSHQDPHNQ